MNRVGDYADISDEEAFRKLVLQVEAAIKDENEVTLNVLTRTDSSESAVAKPKA